MELLVQRVLSASAKSVVLEWKLIQPLLDVPSAH